VGRGVVKTDVKQRGPRAEVELRREETGSSTFTIQKKKMM